jgi:hypothetical protein
MKTLQVRLAAGAASLMLASIGISAAGGTGGPSTSEPLAVIDATHDPAMDTVVNCAGLDGQYQEIRSRSQGTMLSSDPRLNGTATTNEHITINRSTLTGAVVGDIEVRDPVTGELKLEAAMYAVFKGVPVKGVIVGRLRDGQRLVANFSAVHEPPARGPHRIVGVIGGPTASVDLSVIQDVGCTGVPLV